MSTAWSHSPSWQGTRCCPVWRSYWWHGLQAGSPSVPLKSNWVLAALLQKPINGCKRTISIIVVKWKSNIQGFVRHVHLQEGSSFLLPIKQQNQNRRTKSSWWVQSFKCDPKTEIHFNQAHKHDEDPEDRLNLSEIDKTEVQPSRSKALRHNDNNGKSNVPHILLL